MIMKMCYFLIIILKMCYFYRGDKVDPVSVGLI